MTKPTKISAGHYEYRGFRIEDSYRTGWQIMLGDIRGWVSSSNSLRNAIRKIDAWFTFHSQGRLNHEPTRRAVEKIIADACERGESIDCPDAHTCRHGINA
jgi:hypothetical protein